MSAPRRTVPRPRFEVVLVLAMVVCAGGAVAQFEVSGGGRALDGSLRLGSGGYNSRRVHRPAIARPLYTPGTSKPIFTVSGSGQMRYNPHNAFNPHSRYTSTGRTGDRFSPGAQRAFRGRGQY